MPRTRIGIASLINAQGCVVLPEQVSLQCPRCKTLVADKGQCLAELVANPKKVKLIVDCRDCGCYGESPEMC